MARKAMRRFSLIEVIIAFSILSVAAVMAMEILTRSASECYDAEQDWAREHLLANSLEYYLLVGHHGDSPQHLLPNGISVTCEVEALENDDEAILQENLPQGWILARYHVRLFDADGEVASQIVDKIIPEQDL